MQKVSGMLQGVAVPHKHKFSGEVSGKPKF
jgi:hypothetical protein